jgi:ATP-dependent DNA ligase
MAATAAVDSIEGAFYAPAISLRPRPLPAGFIAPCLPTKAPTPSGAEWLHEIKHDGFRVIARKATAFDAGGGRLQWVRLELVLRL